MKIKTRLQFGGILVAALLIVTILIGYNAFRQAAKYIDHAEMANRIEHDVVELNFIIYEYLLDVSK